MWRVKLERKYLEWISRKINFERVSWRIGKKVIAMLRSVIIGIG